MKQLNPDRCLNCDCKFGDDCKADKPYKSPVVPRRGAVNIPALRSRRQGFYGRRKEIMQMVAELREK